jgi:hypothetical protein
MRQERKSTTHEGPPRDFWFPEEVDGSDCLNIANGDSKDGPLRASVPWRCANIEMGARNYDFHLLVPLYLKRQGTKTWIKRSNDEIQEALAKARTKAARALIKRIGPLYAV